MEHRYVTLASLTKNGKRVGFKIADICDTSKKPMYLSCQAVKQMIDSNQSIDLIYDNRGFKFRDHAKKMYNLPEETYNFKNTRVIDINRYNADVYTGNTLKDFIQSTNVANLQCRDFVDITVSYCKSNINRVLAISGLRGTGKTTGVLQTISKLNKYNECVYICINEQSNMNCNSLRELIDCQAINAEYIFIDEITRVKDFIKCSGFLCDYYCNNGKKVVISGTDSLALAESSGAGLYHRMINRNVTFMSFEEAKRTMKYKFEDYMLKGGLFCSDAIRTTHDVRNYINTAVIDNIMNTLTKNNNVTSLLGLYAIDVETVRSLVFKILYAIIYCNTQKIKDISVKKIIDLYDYSASPITSIDVLQDLVCNAFNVERTIKATTKQVQAVLNAMESIGLIVSIPNLYDDTQLNYYVTNPSIVNVILVSMRSVLDKINMPRNKDKTLKGLYGSLLEAIVVSHVVNKCKHLYYKCFYYHDSNNREIDLIINNDAEDSIYSTGNYYCYEIKMSSDIDTAVVKSLWIKDQNIINYINSIGNYQGSEIIYTGGTKQFNGFSDQSIYQPKNCSLQQLESQNNNIICRNAVNYILNPFKYIKDTEE